MTRVWRRPDFHDIAYSDGKRVEERLLEIVSGARNLGSFSPELQRHCTDWPSLYHLSGTRTNLLRPLREHVRGAVLELGAGCGAVTRFLGECGADVVAVEGTVRRASIARQRTRDLPNVQVVADDIMTFESDVRFDVITLVGVLEYAELFATKANPHRAILERARALLGPKGILIIAIENRYGLKYLAGAPEDHLGIPMIGVEDRYPAHGVKTFGRADLTAMLERAGYSTIEFAAPLPDYKFPASIVTMRGINDPEFDAGQLFWQSVRRDPQRVLTPSFLLERVWPGIVANGIALDLSNSFLVAASPAPERTVFPPDLLAVHYSSERHPYFCKQVEFRRDPSGTISTITDRLAGEGVVAGSEPCPNQSATYKHILVSPDRYCRGRLFVEDFRDLVTRPGWRMEEVCAYLRRFMSTVEDLSRAENEPIAFSSSTTFVPGRYLDAHPANLVILEGVKFRLFDLEWLSITPIPATWFLLRSLWASIGSVSLFAPRASDNLPAQLSLGEFGRSVLAGIGFPMTDIEYDDICSREIEFQRWVNGGYCAATLSHFRDGPLKNEFIQLWEQSREVLSLREQVQRLVIDNRTMAEENQRSNQRHAAVEEQLTTTLREERQLAAALRSQIVRDFEALTNVQTRLRNLEDEIKWIHDSYHAVITSRFVRVGSTLGLVPRALQRTESR